MGTGGELALPLPSKETEAQEILLLLCGSQSEEGRHRLDGWIDL